MLRTYEDLHADLLASSTNLSQRLAEILFLPLLEDDARKLSTMARVTRLSSMLHRFKTPGICGPPDARLAGSDEVP